MSLINNMLLDLEARQPSVAPSAAARPVYQDLQAANNSAPPTVPARLSLVLTLLTVSAAALAWWMWPPAARAPALLPAAENLPVARIERVPQPPAEMATLPDREPHVADPTPAIASAAVVATVAVAPALPARRHTPQSAIPAPPARLPSINVEPVSVIKTQRVVSAAEHADSAYRDGQRRYAEQDYPDAERNFRSALEFDPHHRAAREQLATLLLESGRSAQAQGLLEQGIAQVPEHAEFALLLARIQVEQHHEADALTMLEQAATHTDENVDINAFIAALQQRAGRHAQAAQRYQQALAARPLEGRWWVGLAISLEAQQAWPAAHDAYARALSTALNPELARYAEQRLATLRGHR